MSLTSEIQGYFLTPTGSQQGLSAQLQEYALYTIGGMSASQQDFAVYIIGGMSAQLQDQAGGPVIVKGINLTSGQFQLVTAADVVTRSNSSVFSSTGIRGVTGLRGVTGVAPLGDTGLLGDTGASFTGLAGVTGLIGIQGLLGATGLQGATGNVGITGLLGISGVNGEEGFRFLGDTGLQGITGLFGITGFTIQGLVGPLGETGLVGITGIEGSTGVVPNNQGLLGVVGLPIGGTGLVGISGVSLSGSQGPLITLNAQNPVTNLASYILPANSLETNEQYLQLLVWGTLNQNVANAISLTFGTTTLLAANIYIDTQATNFNTFYLTATIIRVGGTSQECISEITAPNDVKFASRAHSTNDLSLTNTFSLTLDAGAIIRGFLVRKGLQA